MNEVEFYRGARSDHPQSRSNSERYDVIGETKDNSTEENGYIFYTGSNFNNASNMDRDARREPSHKAVNNQLQNIGNTSGSIKSFDSTGKQKSFRRLIARFAEKTSMQGVPYINNAKFWWTRLIWCFMLLAAIAAMSLHLWYLIDQYMDYPVQTKISLGFETLKFPEITICNANVMHKKRVDKYDGAEKLKELLENLHPENLVPDQFDPNYDPHGPKPPPPGGQEGGGKQGPGGLPDSGSTSGSQKPPIRRKRFLNEYKNFNKTKFGGKDRPNFREIGPKDQNDFDGELDSRTELEDLFKWLFMSIPKQERAELGHNITDMLISCTFNGRMCSSNMFTLHQTTEYGNCWSISSDKFKVRHPGPSGGLSLVFYLEVTEYLKGLTTGYGARIQIHEQRTYPFPAEEGLFIPASMETDIGLRMISISRQSGLYGDCNDGQGLEKYTTYKYTRSACQALCLTNKIMEICRCFDEKLEELAMSKNNGLHPCRNQTEIECMTKLKNDFVKHDVPCTCFNPCSEVQYVKSVSQRQWPDDDYAMVLLQDICNKDPDVCASLRGFIDNTGKMKGNRVIANNFLKLNIYYEDLNFENLTEVPEIEIQQFLSDVGGAIGLWIGLSILSLCELVQLFVELCDYGLNKTIKETRKGRRQRRKAKRNLAVTSAKSTSIAQDEDKLPRKYFSNDYDNKRFETDFPEGLQNGNAREYSYRK